MTPGRSSRKAAARTSHPDGRPPALSWLDVSARRAARFVLITAALFLPGYALAYAQLSPAVSEQWGFWLAGEAIFLGVLAVERLDDREGLWFWRLWRAGHYLTVLWFGVIAAMNQFAPLYTTGLIWTAATTSVTFNLELRHLRQHLYFMGWIVGVTGVGVYLTPDPAMPALDLMTGMAGLVFIFLPFLGWRLALVRRERLYSSLFENSGSGVILWRDGRIVTCNQRAEALFGRSDEELLGSGPPDLLLEEPLEESELVRALDRLAEPADGEEEVQFEARFSDGEEGHFWAEVILSPLELDRDRFVQALIWDITDRKNYERELEEARADAERAKTLSSRILGNMSHEIRGPLATIRGYAEMLQEEVDVEDRRLVDPIYESSRRLLSQVGELLRLARVEAGTRDLERERMRVLPAVRDVLADQSLEAERKGVSLEIQAEEESLEAELDPEAFQQIVYNLVHNALKFTDEGRVEVHLRETNDGALKLEVADEGIGMDEEDLEDIFDPFRQGNGTSGGKPEGLGLGLSIVRRLVQLHDGTIDIESTQGAGTTVTVRFPVKKETPVLREP